MSSDLLFNHGGDSHFAFDLNEQPVNIEGDLFDLNEIPQETEENQHQHSQPANHHQTSRPKLSTERRMEILVWLLTQTIGGHLKRGSILAAANHFHLSTRCISKIWNTAKRQQQAGQRYNLSTKWHNAGRKRIHVSAESISSLGMGDRSCIRDLATQLNLSKTTVHRLIKRNIIRPHTNALHPGMTEANKKVRLKWILGLLEGDTPETKNKYYTMFDFVHIDEKWFYQSKKSHRVYLAKGEQGKYRSASSSKWIPKVMFTGCVARPRFNSEGQCTFDGKIGIFPFTYKEAAKRSSKNRGRGTMITKTVERVNQSVTRHMLIHQIIPAIIQKWPAQEGHKTIIIQQDNAKAHITQQDKEWQRVYQQEDFTFYLLQQPPNSPDLNILDLGFFRSIQSLMHKKMPRDIDNMLDAVYQAFYELQPKTLSNVWMSLQYVMNEVLKSKGGNEYDLPHVSKQRMESLGLLQTQVQPPAWAVQEAWDIIHGRATQEEEAQVIEDEDIEPDTQETQDIADLGTDY